MTTSASGTVPSRQALRIQRDVKVLVESGLPFIKDVQYLDNDGVNEVTGTLIGPDNTPYAGGHFQFLIRFPPEYPFKPPEFLFITRICHPNILFIDGSTCHDQLNATWAPSITLAKFVTEIHALLENPNYDVPVENDSLKEKNPEKARAWTEEFAHPSGKA